VRVLRRARGWSAAWKSSYRLRYKLPGDTSGLADALHALNGAGLLAPNATDRSITGSGRPRTGPCPRCGRQTACNYWDGEQWVTTLPTVCTGCRAESLTQVAPQLAEWNRGACADGHRARKCSCYEPVGHTADCLAVLRGWV
jgi:hypothetical protein